MRLLLFGAGEFGLPTFESLRQRHHILAVISQPDRPAGRHRKLTPTPVAQWAVDHALTILKSEDVNQPMFLEELQTYQPDASVVIAFGQKLSPQLIAQGGRLMVNLHSSLLPAYRGAAPINRAMLAGEKTTGVSVIALAQQMDAGLIYHQSAMDIDPLETAGELHDRLAQLGPAAVGQVLADLEAADFDASRLHAIEQDASRATRAPKLSKAQSPVDFSRTANEVRCQVHGLTPWPGASVMWHRQGQDQPTPLFLRRVEVIETDKPHDTPGLVMENAIVHCNSGSIRLLELQLPGKRLMTVDEFSRGHALRPGDRLTSQ